MMPITVTTDSWECALERTTVSMSICDGHPGHHFHYGLFTASRLGPNRSKASRDVLFDNPQPRPWPGRSVVPSPHSSCQLSAGAGCSEPGYGDWSGIRCPSASASFAQHHSGSLLQTTRRSQAEHMLTEGESGNNQDAAIRILAWATGPSTALPTSLHREEERKPHISLHSVTYLEIHFPHIHNPWEEPTRDICKLARSQNITCLMLMCLFAFKGLSCSPTSSQKNTPHCQPTWL